MQSPLQKQKKKFKRNYNTALKVKVSTVKAVLPIKCITIHTNLPLSEGS